MPPKSNPPGEAESSATAARVVKKPPPAKKDWIRSAGWAKDDPLYDEAVRLGAEYRQSLTWEQENAGT